MSKKQKNAAVISILIIIIAVIALFFHFFYRVSFYEDESTTGNTSSNLLNGGLFCEADGTIYFANPYDENTLYTMNTNLENIKQIASDNVSYLNVAGKYIFYTKRNDKKESDYGSLLALSATGLYRMTTNGKNISRLYDDPTQVACLYGNQIFYQHYDQSDGLLLYSVQIDGSSDEMLLEEPCAPYAVEDQTIYYTGSSDDHAIHTMQTDGSNKQTLYDGNFTGLTKQGEYLYFLDMNDDYSLKRLSLDSNTVETLISDRVATYNVHPDEDSIYCQIDNGTNNSGLYLYDISRNSLECIQTGNYNYLHLTSDYLFYEEYDQSKLYVLYTDTNKTEEFIPDTE